MSSSKNLTNIHEQAVASFVDLMVQKINSLEESKWVKPWFPPSMGSLHPQNLSGSIYRGANSLILLMDTSVHGYRMPIYTTFESARKMGFFPTKGSKSTRIFFWKHEYVNKKTGDRISPEDYKRLPDVEMKEYTYQSFVKMYNVFNLDQTNFKEVHPEKWDALCQTSEKEFKGHEQLDALIDRQNWYCPIREKAIDQAFYNPVNDFIEIPERGQFVTEESFYNTLLHEMVHSTGAKDRLNRDLSGPFGSEQYAREELVAELTAAMLGRSVGFSPLPTKESALYLKSWLKHHENATFLFKLLNDVGRAHNMTFDRVQSQEIDISKVVTPSSERVISDSSPELQDPTALYLQKMQHNELICAAILNTDGDLIRHLSTPSVALQEVAIRQNPHAIRYIPEATEAMQLLACKMDGMSIQYIPFPTEKMKLEAVKQAPGSIAFLKEPSEAIQMAAVKKDPTAISFISEPCKRVQTFLEQSSGPKPSKSSKLSEELQPI